MVKFYNSFRLLVVVIIHMVYYATRALVYSLRMRLPGYWLLLTINSSLFDCCVQYVTILGVAYQPIVLPAN